MLTSCYKHSSSAPLVHLQVALYPISVGERTRAQRDQLTVDFFEIMQLITGRAEI